MEYYSALKKRAILPFVTTWMDPEGMMLRKQKDKCCILSLTCGIYIKSQTHKNRVEEWLSGAGDGEIGRGKRIQTLAII